MLVTVTMLCREDFSVALLFAIYSIFGLIPFLFVGFCWLPSAFSDEREAESREKKIIAL